ncbi:helix-turn-helix domain-containing protein [Tahibacter caeni]|uniref:helix-turn-helix domain-containing protein n=1 Tax=Tahibacter caeni TaxID=1453545 RepID=UPI00214785D4|nr:helix-turn-helix domain-containing protein [Tahibacter caeni]
MVNLRRDKPRGVLHSGDVTPEMVHARYWPSPDLVPFVEHYWTVEWDLDAPLRRETLPHPVVHIVLENGEATLTGPSTRRFVTTLAGKGRVFGIKFHPGGFRPFLGGPVSAYADRTVALGEIFRQDAADLVRRALARDAHAETIAVLEAFLRERDPRIDATAVSMAAIAKRMADDREITRIEQIVREFGIGLRTLQRQFRDYVGVHPKWAIQRYRLHEALARIDDGTMHDWATLASDLRYADQAHLIRDFKKLVGLTPAEYARAAPRAAPADTAARR